MAGGASSSARARRLSERAEIILFERGLTVTLVELQNQVMPPADPEVAALLHQELRLNGVGLRLGTSVTAFETGDDTLASLHAAAVCANVTSLEMPFDRDRRRAAYQEPIENGRMCLADSEGWGIRLP